MFWTSQTPETHLFSKLWFYHLFHWWCRFGSPKIRGQNVTPFRFSFFSEGKVKKCKLQILEFFAEIAHAEEDNDVNCNENARFRTIDGTCNNLERPLWGSVGDKFLRLEPADYGDCVSAVRRAKSGDEMPNARQISINILGSNDCPNPNNNVLTHLTMNFGQFMDHDITLAEAQGLNCEPYNPNPECINIQVPEGDSVFLDQDVHEFEFERDAPHKPAISCKPITREHSNVITAYIDASNVYGSTEELLEELRAPDGRMLVMKQPHGCPLANLLPALPPEEACVSKDPLRPCFHAGDERVNENQGTTGNQAQTKNFFHSLKTNKKAQRDKKTFDKNCSKNIFI